MPHLLRRTTALATLACTLGLTVAGALSLGTTPAAAQQTDAAVYDGAKARVNRSASLRALSEAIASASCRMSAGIETETATQELADFRDDFRAILAALENGSDIMGMPGAEKRARLLNVIHETESQWNPMDEAIAHLLDGTGSQADTAVIRTSYKPLFDQTVILAADVSGQYSDPLELMQSDATVLNFADRQRMLVQRMTRDMCELAAGTASEGTLEELTATVELFDLSLTALRDGMPAAGVKPPPSDAIKASLSATYGVWQENHGIFDAVMAGQTPTPEDVVASAQLSRDLSVAMNNAITLYLIATPGQDGVYRVPLEVYARTELAEWLTDPALIEALRAQNSQNADLSEADIIALDQQWRAEAAAGDGPLIAKLLNDPVSQWLAQQQTATAGFVTEVFVMDNKGLNVAQSVETSDYWQGDEAKWQQTYSVGPDALHISDVEFDDSTGFYQSQASLPIQDPDTGAVIGAVTFGINVQNLM
ncbi:type IV pili methyl-accepting chemotaxis transducer N-terminal domain-containing protein [Jannaschia pohangensis]|uniref:Type IV pili methyl-accepting chemotaxis transducer N-term n=1 Tax=Jannaschia pohangensis TaxID=390807 RepID=A0A1I3UZH7_9RHOB|nr:type IV pili methyl-accepting chemotaxis transducer N-terminal domain-containing protein [Jannaschia pohangensis]SFJ88834.1 Type IV pili methyl-accepting chemotaxis transducer N-term [Jannaschia pohangensis]